MPADRSGTKSVRILEGLAIPRNAGALNFYVMFREIAANPVKTLPARDIAGKKAVGFVARNPVLEGDPQATNGPKPEITVWVDPETSSPSRSRPSCGKRAVSPRRRPPATSSSTDRSMPHCST